MPLRLSLLRVVGQSRGAGGAVLPTQVVVDNTGFVQIAPEKVVTAGSTHDVCGSEWQWNENHVISPLRTTS